MDKYYKASNQQNQVSVVPPPKELIEVILMEKFQWLPEEIDRIPYRKIQEIFLVLKQREMSQAAVN